MSTLKTSGIKMYDEAVEIYADLKEIVASTQQEFVAMGVSFDRSFKNFGPTIEEALERGVTFKYVCLSRNADLSLFAKQFGQSTEELRTEVHSSYAAFERFRSRYPDRFHFYPTKRCPNYRIYIRDPQAESPEGILVFYGSSTDSPYLPAFRVENFRDSAFAAYFKDALSALQHRTQRKVFIIHGHNEAKWRELEELLRSLQLEPVVMLKEPDLGVSTMIEKFERVARDCAYAIAIFTPDDWVQTRQTSYFQPRPNAIFELGWFSARLGRSRVMILLQGEVEILSDLAGVAKKRFVSQVAEKFKEIQDELRELEILDS